MSGTLGTRANPSTRSPACLSGLDGLVSFSYIPLRTITILVL